LSFNFNSVWQTLLLLSVMVVIHEYGHFTMARRFGVKVHEFSIGFGPLLAKLNWKDVQYSLRLFLLGGFVKIAGMEIALEGETDGPVEPGRSFQDLSLWKKVVVIAAGPFFNLLLAIALLFGTAAFVGLPSHLRNDAPVIEQAFPGTPAFNAGLRPGDWITAINNERVAKWLDISKLVTKYRGNTIIVKLKRKQTILTKKITPIYNSVEKRYIIGINPVSKYKRTSVGQAVRIALTYPWTFTGGVFKSFAMMFTGKLKGGLIGPLGMVSVIEQNTYLPLYHNLFLAFQISMFLFIFNMLPLPLPLLDGGWIIILLLERMIGREFTAGQKAAAQSIGLAAVLLLGIAVAYGDTLTIFKRFFGG